MAIIKRKNYMVSMYDDDNTYLRENGMNKSKFIRQAIAAHKDKEWKFNYLED